MDSKLKLDLASEPFLEALRGNDLSSPFGFTIAAKVDPGTWAVIGGLPTPGVKSRNEKKRFAEWREAHFRVTDFKKWATGHFCQLSRVLPGGIVTAGIWVVATSIADFEAIGKKSVDDIMETIATRTPDDGPSMILVSTESDGTKWYRWEKGGALNFSKPICVPHSSSSNVLTSLCRITCPIPLRLIGRYTTKCIPTSGDPKSEDDITRRVTKSLSEVFAVADNQKNGVQRNDVPLFLSKGAGSDVHVIPQESLDRPLMDLQPFLGSNGMLKVAVLGAPDIPQGQTVIWDGCDQRDPDQMFLDVTCPVVGVAYLPLSITARECSQVLAEDISRSMAIRLADACEVLTSSSKPSNVVPAEPPQRFHWNLLTMQPLTFSEYAYPKDDENEAKANLMTICGFPSRAWGPRDVSLSETGLRAPDVSGTGVRFSAARQGGRRREPPPPSSPLLKVSLIFAVAVFLLSLCVIRMKL